MNTPIRVWDGRPLSAATSRVDAGYVENDERNEAERQLKVIEAVLAGIARHHEVADVIFGSASLVAAEQSVQELLGLEDLEMVRAVLDLQVRRLTLDERERLSAAAASLKAELGN